MIYLSETKYITGVIIANGIPDSDGDVLTKKDIKIISTKYRDRLTDVMHSRIKNEGVDVIHDWISETETRINGQLVPAGSWLADFAVSNTEILKAIDENELRGLSLGSVSEDALTRKTWFINKRMTYSDLKSMEEVIPLFISFVDKPANGFTFEVNEYEVFINKRADTGDNEANERDTMSKEEKVEINKNEEAMVPTSFVEKLLDKFTINKAEETEPIVEETVEEPAVDEPAEDLATQLLGKFDAILANQEKIIEQNDAILAGLNKEEATEEEEEEIEKAEEEEEEEVVEETPVETDEEEVDKAEEDETTEEENSEEEDGINKRETGMPADINKNQAPKKTFYQRTGRDALGRKIKH